MYRSMFGDTGFSDRFFDDRLDSRIVDVMAADSSTARINREIIGRKNIT
ncbi:MAG: hypothetical protein AB2L12_05390 [Smithellaceae bacterium]